MSTYLIFWEIGRFYFFSHDANYSDRGKLLKDLFLKLYLTSKLLIAKIIITFYRSYGNRFEQSTLHSTKKKNIDIIT